MPAFRKIITIILIQVMMVNAIGVAQVRHICKMAAFEMSASCIKTTPIKHACCDNIQRIKDAEKLKNAKGCCKNEIRYFRQASNSIVHQCIKLKSVDSYISLLFKISDEKLQPEIFTSFFADLAALHRTGSAIILSNQTFRI